MYIFDFSILFFTPKSPQKIGQWVSKLSKKLNWASFFIIFSSYVSKLTFTGSSIEWEPFGQLGHPLTDFLWRLWGEKNDKKIKNIHSILFFVVQLDFSEPSNNGFIVEKSWFLFSLGNDLKRFKIEQKNEKNAFQGHN